MLQEFRRMHPLKQAAFPILAISILYCSIDSFAELSEYDMFIEVGWLATVWIFIEVIMFRRDFHNMQLSSHLIYAIPAAFTLMHILSGFYNLVESPNMIGWIIMAGSISVFGWFASVLLWDQKQLFDWIRTIKIKKSPEHAYFYLMLGLAIFYNIFGFFLDGMFWTAGGIAGVWFFLMAISNMGREKNAYVIKQMKWIAYILVMISILFLISNINTMMVQYEDSETDNPSDINYVVAVGAIILIFGIIRDLFRKSDFRPIRHDNRS